MLHGLDIYFYTKSHYQQCYVQYKSQRNSNMNIYNLKSSKIKQWWKIFGKYFLLWISIFLRTAVLSRSHKMFQKSKLVSFVLFYIIDNFLGQSYVKQSLEKHLKGGTLSKYGSKLDLTLKTRTEQKCLSLQTWVWSIFSSHNNTKRMAECLFWYLTWRSKVFTLVSTQHNNRKARRWVLNQILDPLTHLY